MKLSGGNNENGARYWADFAPHDLSASLSEAARSESVGCLISAPNLGSSSFITNKNGLASQHFLYLPFGEQFVEQKITSTYYTPYKFSGKEKDAETSYSYFGARYYDSDLSVWLSVDPMSDIYPSTSPYMYVRGNPIRLIDPNGMFDKETKAQKSHDKAVKKYGKDNVGEVHNIGKDGKNNFVYDVYGKGKDKYTHGSSDGLGVMAYRPDAVISSNSDERKFNRYYNVTKDLDPKTIEALNGLGGTVNLISLAAQATTSELRVAAYGLRTLGAISSGTAVIGTAITYGVAYYEIREGLANTHTFVDVTVATAGLVVIGVAAVASAPITLTVAAAVSVGYGIASACGLGKEIDEGSDNWGRKQIYGK